MQGKNDAVCSSRAGIEVGVGKGEGSISAGTRKKLKTVEQKCDGIDPKREYPQWNDPQGLHLGRLVSE